MIEIIAHRVDNKNILAVTSNEEGYIRICDLDLNIVGEKVLQSEAMGSRPDNWIAMDNDRVLLEECLKCKLVRKID